MKNTQKMKYYLEIPFMSKWRRGRKITCIPVGLWLNISWDDYDFELCDTEEYFPKGEKNGKHKLSISFGIFYWSLKLTFYSPKTQI